VEDVFYDAIWIFFSELENFENFLRKFRTLLEKCSKKILSPSESWRAEILREKMSKI
jgi:hypothetical protein